MTIASSSASAASSLPTLQVEARRVLALYAEAPGDSSVWQQLLTVRRALAAVIATLPPGNKTGPALEIVSGLLHAFEESGASDQPASAEDLALAQTYLSRSWPGLLASMLLVPAWQLPEAPLLDKVAPWLWAEYTRYLFYTPKGFAAVGQAEAYAAHSLLRLEELANWGQKNRGSAAVRIALQVYMGGNNCIPLYFNTGSLRRHYELRGQILKIASGVGAQEDMLPAPRDDRRLRVGFINRHFGQQTETYTTLPTFEHLDPDRFEVILFACHATNSQVENYCRERASDFRLLAKDVNDQVNELRACNLDIAVFGTNVTAVFHEITRLALYRVAPLQVVNNSSCTTSGLPEIDLYVSGALTESAQAAEHFTERLGLIPGPAHSFQYSVDQQEPTNTFTRADLNIPEDAVVFASAANYFKVIPEMQHAWARLLAAVPGSRLLLHPFNPNWSSSYPIKRFCAEFDRVLAEHGVTNDRLVVSTLKFPSRSDVKELLSLGDIYLDTYPFGGVNSLVDPLELGLPVVAWEGETFRARMGGALLRSLELGELVTQDAQTYHDTIVALANDQTRRVELSNRIRAMMERGAIFLDTLAHSDAFGQLLTLAFDELLFNGREEFRRAKTPLALPTEADPAALLADGVTHLEAGLATEAVACAYRLLGSNAVSTEARHLLGRALVAQGRIERGMTYLLTAVQHAENNARLWYDLALALRSSGRMQDAISALETSLRSDDKNLEAWFLFLELAESMGQTDMAKEVVQVVQQLAPSDPRVVNAVAMAGLG